MTSYQAVCDSWNWEAMSVASKILLRSGITHCLIGSAALQLHGVYDNYKDHAPWQFANTFEVCVRSRDIAKAQEALGQHGLFATEGSASDEYHTIYEGTGRLVKLRATFTSSRDVHLILLPQEDYFAVDGTILYLHAPGPPVVRGGSPPTLRRATPGGQLPVERNMSTMLLSLLHRAFARHDHAVARLVARISLPRRKCTARPPTYWDEAMQAGTRKWLADHQLLDEDADKTNATSEAKGSQADEASASPPCRLSTSWLAIPDYLAPVDTAMTMTSFVLEDLRGEKEEAEMQGDAHDDKRLPGDAQLMSWLGHT
ncbi:hypothetical protein MAJ_09628, partial [Metarhizium majus ARSEF 297]